MIVWQRIGKSSPDRSASVHLWTRCVIGLATNEWQVARIHKALTSLDRGKGIAHARVSEWIASWETRN